MSGVLAPLVPHLEAAVAAFAHEHGVASVAAGAAVRGEPPWTFGYGTTDVEGGRRPGGETPYRVGSLTKPFTAAAVVRLRDRGALDLEDPVAGILPEFAAVPGGGSVRLRDLVLHRGGLPSEIPELDEASGAYPTIEQVLEGLAGVRLLHPPGSAMRYSNLGYQLLGEVVSRAAGSNYAEACARELFDPLGLQATGFDRPDGAARGHRARAFTDRLRAAPDRRKRTLADGALWSTAADQVAWIRAQLGEHALDLAPSLRAMHGPEAGTTDGGGPGQGLGWFRERLGARTIVYHQGSTPGFAARLAFSPDLGAGVVTLANGEVAMAGLTASLIDLVLDGVGGAFPREPAAPVPPAPRAAAYPPAWDELLGFYVWPGSAFLYRLEERAGSLRLVDVEEGGEPVSLEADPTADRFIALDGGWAGERVQVVRGPDRRVRGLRVGPWFVVRLIEAGETFGPGF
jgi:CubicO group peptidase (beta-lactamase class C family)